MWLPDDTEAALEWMEYKASLCVGCSRPRAESFDRSNEESYEVEPLRCHACAARDRKSKLVGNDEHADTSGMYFAVVRGDGRDD